MLSTSSDFNEDEQDDEISFLSIFFSYFICSKNKLGYFSIIKKSDSFEKDTFDIFLYDSNDFYFSFGMNSAKSSFATFD